MCTQEFEAGHSHHPVDEQWCVNYMSSHLEVTGKTFCPAQIKEMDHTPGAEFNKKKKQIMGASNFRTKSRTGCVGLLSFIFLLFFAIGSDSVSSVTSQIVNQ